MPVIRITEATWERMKVHARPLEDTPDDIVRRALDALEGKSEAPKVRRNVGRPTAQKAGRKLPQKSFRDPLLQTLLELGCSGQVSEIRAKMLPKVAAMLSEADYATVSTGEPRWWNATCWERNELVKAGLLAPTERRGVWELTEAGIQRAAEVVRDAKGSGSARD